MVILIIIGGLWSTIVNMGIFTWALNSGLSLEEAMTMPFISLILIQFFKAYNFRSDRHSVLNHPFSNKWLNLAIPLEILLLGAIIEVPLLREVFGTKSLSMTQWLILLGAALTVSPVLEIAKWIQQRR